MHGKDGRWLCIVSKYLGGDASLLINDSWDEPQTKLAMNQCLKFDAVKIFLPLPLALPVNICREAAEARDLGICTEKLGVGSTPDQSGNMDELRRLI